MLFTIQQHKKTLNNMKFDDQEGLLSCILEMVNWMNSCSNNCVKVLFLHLLHCTVTQWANTSWRQSQMPATLQQVMTGCTHVCHNDNKKWENTFKVLHIERLQTAKSPKAVTKIKVKVLRILLSTALVKEILFNQRTIRSIIVTTVTPRMTPAFSTT